MEDGIRTPALLVERSILERNIDAMAARARRLGVRLRPHFKTHKCVEVARRQAEGGATGFTVATVPEAEALLEAGFRDLTWAVPLDPGKVGDALGLAARATVRLLLDDETTLEHLEREATRRGLRPHVWLKVDCGYHRAGVDPSRPESAHLAGRLAASGAVTFDGLLTHAGHSYQARDPGVRRGIAAQERDVMRAFAERLRGAGVSVPALSVGSTPTMTAVDHLEGIDEIRPGNYVYFDATQAALGSCTLDDVAISVLATVISHPPGGGRAVVDAGALALSRDPGPAPPADGGAAGYGAVCPHPGAPAPDAGLQLVSLSQEHGVIQARPGHTLEGRLPVGSRVRILPNHSCLVSACFDEAHVVEGGRVAARWAIHRRR